MQFLRVFTGKVPRALTATTALALLLITSQASSQTLFAGEPVAIGDGQARVIVVEGRQGVPASISVVLSRAALEGLPEARADREAFEYVLPMPGAGPRTGYRHVSLDWNPIGHIPEGIYSVPHFDMHFYLISSVEQQGITFLGPDRDRAIAPPDPSRVPPGYVVPPDTAVERMGLHGLDPGGHEFHGQPFTHNFLYGYHERRLIFVEPMISLAYLTTRPDVTVPVKIPAAYSLPGYYPDRYRVGFNPATEEYQVALLGLRPYGM